MNKLFCFLLTLFLYSTNHCVNTYVYAFINENARSEDKINKLEDGSWHLVESVYDLKNGSHTVVNEGPANADTVEFISNMANSLITDPEIRYSAIIKLLDQETITFLKNKEFIALDNDGSQILVLTLTQHEDLIELVMREATPEERNIYTKIKAIGYAIIKKALDEYHQQAS